jgi:hypothetical protein
MDQQMANWTAMPVGEPKVIHENPNQTIPVEMFIAMTASLMAEMYGRTFEMMGPEYVYAEHMEEGINAALQVMEMYTTVLCEMPIERLCFEVAMMLHRMVGDEPCIKHLEQMRESAQIPDYIWKLRSVTLYLPIIVRTPAQLGFRFDPFIGVKPAGFNA